MASPPDLKIPSSSTTVQVRIIDTTSQINDGIRAEGFFSPVTPGFEMLHAPSYSFLIEHSSGRKFLFDLGVRKDHENFAPRIAEMLNGCDIQVEKGVREQLEEHGIDGQDIEAIIWSHWHFDHIGDPSTFPPSTALIVGPGFTDAFTPAYPTKQDSPLLDSDFEGRELKEVSFESGLKIGRLNALDLLGDGSFYLLDSPGHAIGHLCGLARVTSGAEGSSFIFMGGDAAHHGGELRPTEYLPLPAFIQPNPFNRRSRNPCPGAVVEHLLRDGDRTKPFYEVASKEDGSQVAHDVKEAQNTINKIQEADARDEIFVVLAHDESLLDVVDFFPKYANDFVQKGWVQEGRWLFLKDFEAAREQSGA
ncbi:MAG: hypothetical protein M1818_002248 [Claussenomyces sp. TS43310]|nr:MAG: hypothetical protein M1818_002248 [Claussenomyces sp. TS43310]